MSADYKLYLAAAFMLGAGISMIWAVVLYYALR